MGSKIPSAKLTFALLKLVLHFHNLQLSSLQMLTSVQCRPMTAVLMLCATTPKDLTAACVHLGSLETEGNAKVNVF